MVLQRSGLVRVLVAIGLVALAAAGLRLSQGGADRDFEIVRGVGGEPVVINDGTVTADDVRVGTSLSRDDTVTAVTAGLFVAVRVEIAATGPTKIATLDSSLLAGDRRYAEIQDTGTGTVAPGFLVSQDLVFEVDPATLASLTLELYPSEAVMAYPQHVRIHLGITPDNAPAWRDAGRNQVVELGERTSEGI